MILGAEIGLLIMGIMAMSQGKLVLTKKRVVFGTPARLLAIVTFLPLPVSFVLGFLLGFAMGASGRNPGDPAVGWQFIALEAGVLVICVGLLYGIGWQLGVDPEAETATRGRPQPPTF